MSESGPDFENDEQDELLPNPAADEFFGRMKHDFRRPKPSEEAIASALQAIQRLTGEVTPEPTPEPPVESRAGKCPKCGAGNFQNNRFCGYCGTPMDRVEEPSTNSEVQAPSEGRHVYHHHYHHHYFSEAEKAAAKKRADMRMASQPILEKQEDASPDAQAEDADTIQKLVQKWSRCFNSKRMDELTELYSSDAIVLRPNAASAHGKQAVRQLLEAALDVGLGDVQFDFAEIGIVGNFACVTGRSRMLVPTAPAKREEETGKYLIVVRRENGQWKIVADSWCMDATKAPVTSATAPVLPIRTQRQ